jgi:hypothetical protein
MIPGDFFFDFWTRREKISNGQSGQILEKSNPQARFNPDKNTIFGIGVFLG